jgi:hypothetical protein
MGTLVQKELFPWLTRRRGGIEVAERDKGISKRIKTEPSPLLSYL